MENAKDIITFVSTERPSLTRFLELGKTRVKGIHIKRNQGFTDPRNCVNRGFH